MPVSGNFTRLVALLRGGFMVQGLSRSLRTTTTRQMLNVLASYIEICQQRREQFSQQRARFAYRRETRRLQRALQYLRLLQLNENNR